jgi:hypothetical protein
MDWPRVCAGGCSHMSAMSSSKESICGGGVWFRAILLHEKGEFERDGCKL